jgi:hypothetical protein
VRHHWLPTLAAALALLALLVGAASAVLVLREERRQTCLANVTAAAWILSATEERGPVTEATRRSLARELARQLDAC